MDLVMKPLHLEKETRALLDTIRTVLSYERSGKLSALTGHEIVRRTFPEPEARHGPA
jgi:hypothetical protein